MEQLLVDGGHKFSDFTDGDWEPGLRVAQAGPRQVNVFYDGPGDGDRLDFLTPRLRAAGCHVHHTQMSGGGRHRLEVTRP